MELRKNQVITLKIDDLGNNGEGIGHVDGYALFVKDALPGETIRARIMKCKKNYGFARMMEVLECSASGRVEPRCPVARQCGGCTLQHLSYEKQLAYKEKKVRDCLVRIGGVDAEKVEWLPVLGMEMPWQYRNKAQFPVRMQEDDSGVLRPVAGFYAGRTHSIIPVTDCAIQHPCMKEILDTILSWMQEQHVPAYDEVSHRGLVRHIYIRRAYHTSQIMVCLVVNSRQISENLKRTLIEKLTGILGVTGILLNINTDQTNVILGKEMILLWGQEHIKDRIGEISYHISPQSFYQVNPVQTEKLYQTALEFAGLTGEETVWDLYCGIGTISLFLAKNAKKVYGVEIVPEAIQNAKENARLNGINNAEFFCGAAEEVVPRLAKELGDARNLVGEEGNKAESETEKMVNLADVVVVDPPRKGCDGVLLDTIVKMAPERIVYVSCDPGTLARDVKVLGEKGYEVRKVRACDMFGQGGHVETVCLLSKLHADQHIEVELQMDELDLTAAESKTAEMPARERKGYKGCVGAFSYGLKHFWGMIDLD
ncbi:MAG: 23S rRNA (uracil(1939)-C(5))-methyltransferase RlmD [Eubacterium sp.]|nr:23S rRNA (uracil(1939)-C(5))-methyltransferase RlmD [Eubacterium sp.]